MTQPRPLEYPITLSTPELSYLLATVHARTLIGGDDRSLFPPEPAAREALWLRGREALEANGWLVRDAAAGHYQINDALMVIIAALADPEVVLLTTWQSAERQRHGVRHYLSRDLVIEMAPQTDAYQLVVLASSVTMVRRLAHQLGLPDGRRADLSFELSHHDVEQARQNPDPAWLESRGLSHQAAQLFAETFRQRGSSGTTTVLRTVAARAVTMRLLGVLVAQDNTAWLATPLEDERIRYGLAGAEDYEAALSATIVELRELPLESMTAAQGS